MIIICFILVLVAGCAYGAMATLQYHFSNSIFMNYDIQFWNPTVSWANKYSDAHNLVRKKWLGIMPIPVMFTDGFHLLQSIFIEAIFIALIFYRPFTNYILLDLFLLRLAFGIGFSFFYNWILIKKP